MAELVKQKRRNSMSFGHVFQNMFHSKSSPSLFRLSGSSSENCFESYGSSYSFSATTPSTAVANDDNCKKQRKRDVIKKRISKIWRLPSRTKEEISIDSGFLSNSSFVSENLNAHENLSFEHPLLLYPNEKDTRAQGFHFFPLKTDDKTFLWDMDFSTTDLSRVEEDSDLVDFKLSVSYENREHSALFRSLQAPFFKLTTGLVNFSHEATKSRSFVHTPNDSTIWPIMKNDTEFDPFLGAKFYLDLKQRLVKIRQENNPLSRSSDF
ncbi:uncharacterized protein PRCAT00001781001 [Priceomyces carsonii]|uniref:uncharacterized protein n=1 Tax=Priceomyces carsonii TaxID=28549 RepID=UPI002ED8919B|nr:unnamed protein product [Priceomyces carsonii]